MKEIKTGGGKNFLGAEKCFEGPKRCDGAPNKYPESRKSFFWGAEKWERKLKKQVFRAPMYGAKRTFFL